MDSSDSAAVEVRTFTTRLRAGMELQYEEFHRAIPGDLDAAMRAAGVLGWVIRRSGTTLTHTVSARDYDRMSLILDQDPINQAWQREVAPFLARSTPAPPLDEQPGELIWDFAWPTR